MNSSYTALENSKNGILIPVKNRIYVCSKYDPVHEAEIFASQFEKKEKFFVVAGLCSGWHIEKLLNENFDRKIIIVENAAEDFDFLRQIPLCKKLSEDSRIIFSTPQSLFTDILSNYLPAIFGNLNFCFLRGWENAFLDKMPLIKTIVEKAIKTVKADFAVQSHFGKIWNKNIFENLKIASEQKNTSQTIENLKKNNEKTAAIIAAGPTLDTTVEKLKKNPDKYFIISTDTAYSSLLRSKIVPDAVVSIDGQNISYAHFLHQAQKNKTVFAFDLCANSIPAKKISVQKSKILFFESGHPLSVLASRFNGTNFIHLNSGSGTVTIAATDLAFFLGFEKIEFFGADFAYLNGKPYAKGTYLDDIFYKKQNRLFTAEQSFCALMYRTELIPLGEKKFTTEVMESYRFSLETYLKNPGKSISVETKDFNFEIFNTFLKKKLLSLPENFTGELKNQILYPLLPLMAFYEKTHSIQDSYKLARADCLRYTY